MTSRIIDHKTHITAMVDESGKVSFLGRVHDVVLVDPEQVGGADALLFVALFPNVGQDRSDNMANILNDHLIGTDILSGKESPVVDG